MNGHFCFVHDQRTNAQPAGLAPAAPRVGPLAGSNATFIVLRLVGSRAQTAPAGHAPSEAIVCRQTVDAGGSLISRAG